MKKTILIVDDEKNIRLTLRETLKRNGFDTDECENGKEGLKKIIENKYDLVFLDIRMPEMNGIEVLRKLDEVDSSVPVVMITAHGNVDNAVECMKLGAVDFLQKPFGMDEVVMLTLRVLRRYEEDPDNYGKDKENYVEVAKKYITLKDYKKAILFLDRMIDEKHDIWQAYYLKGSIEEILGNKDKAASLYSKSLTYNQNFFPAKIALEEINK